MLVQKGFSRVAHIPCIFTSDWQYVVAPSTYLIERALLDWTPGTKNGVGSNRFPTQKSLQAYSEALTNFLEWAELRGVDWKIVTYAEHLIDGYQKEMSQGSWSASGKPLAPATINARMQEVCNFLSWAEKRGLRGEFRVLTTTQKISIGSATDSYGHREREVDVRIGKVRQDPKSLHIPTDLEMTKWLQRVLVQRGETKALMCELILETAVRREEAAGWRVDSVPLRVEDWENRGKKIKATIKFGTKGQGYGKDHTDKIGPMREIWMPIELAQKLHEYRNGPRLAARSKWVKAAVTKEEQRARISQPSPHLFLSETTGERITAMSLYKAWTEVSYLPFEGWSPHLGRHYWACKALLWEAKKRIDQLGLKPDKLPVDWITGNTMSDIQLIIQPQLGHVDKKTSEKYLVWLINMFAGGEGMQIDYFDRLDADEDK